MDSAAAAQPRLLVLSHRVPYPPHNGAAIRTLNILRLLARHFRIHALCFDREDAATRRMPLGDRLEALASLGTFEVFGIAQQASRLRLMRDHAASLLSGRSYLHFVHASRAFERRLATLLATERFDLVHVDSLDLVRHLPRVSSLPCIVTHHNVESALLERRAGAEPSAVRRAYIRHQSRRVREDEATWLPRVALNVAVSDRDADDLRAIGPGARVLVVPNGVDTDYFAPGMPSAAGEGCVFVGGTNYFPNRDALQWFRAEVVPAMRRRRIPVDVTWVGRATPEELREFDGRDGIRLTGYVDDVRPYLDRAACFIAPLRVGGGTRLKLLDAWAMGKAIVSTSIGCEGLRVEPDVNMLVRDDPDGFAEAIGVVLADRARREALARAARETALRSYAWHVLEMDMLGAYRSVIAASDRVMASPSR